jgi:hypothetical protein
MFDTLITTPNIIKRAKKEPKGATIVFTGWQMGVAGWHMVVPGGEVGADDGFRELPAYNWKSRELKGIVPGRGLPCRVHLGQFSRPFWNSPSSGHLYVLLYFKLNKISLM